jgi:hypothetical protein
VFDLVVKIDEMVYVTAYEVATRVLEYGVI